MDKAFAIIILIIIFGIIWVFSAYQKMDRKKLLAQIFFKRNVDKEVKQWMSDLCIVITTLGKTELSAEISDVKEKYEGLKKTQILNKTELINQILDRLGQLDENVTEQLRENQTLSLQNEELLLAFSDYNRLAVAYNEDLNKGMGKTLAQIFHIKKLALLREITL